MQASTDDEHMRERIERHYQDAMMLATMRYMADELEAVSVRQHKLNLLNASSTKG